MKIQNFDDAFGLLMVSEGAYSNNQADPGGETMWGITKRKAVENGYTAPMKDLPQELAKAIAKREYWDRFQCGQFHPEIGFQVFDVAYNGGPIVKWLQQASGAKVDGQLGAATIAAVRGMDRLVITMRLNSYRISYLTSLKTWPTFGKGWMNRIAANLLEGAD